MTYRLTPQAQADIDDIATYIANDDLAAALRWVEQIEKHCRNLASAPHIGASRPQVMDGLRIFPVSRYLILYRIDASSVLILRVVHAARDWQTAISDDPAQPN